MNIAVQNPVQDHPETRPETREPLLVVSNLKKDYVNGDVVAQVLKGINFEIYKGEFVAMLGPSGSGKSTLLSILGTLLRPTSGHFFMLDHDLTTASEDELTQFRNRNIGFVFQYHHLLPDFSALENVMFPAVAAGLMSSNEAEARAAELLTRVGLGHRLNYKATKLSGGQKQRVAVARALMNNPAMVLADEPTGNLDRESTAQVMELLREINQESGTTFLLSTHDPNIAARCGRKITVVDGKIASIETVAAPSKETVAA
ncbi:MAG: ABC transporter ATP-binding protein [Rhodospirillaceae bacterium]|nr:ABC transporter ATP-binding protein [Rhodospirillaceae bacterium]